MSDVIMITGPNGEPVGLVDMDQLGADGRQVPIYLGIGLKPRMPRETDESKSRNGEHRVSPQLTDSDRDSESGVSRLSCGETRSNPLQLLHRTSLSGHACRVCGEAIDPVAGDVHPGCDTEVPR